MVDAHLVAGHIEDWSLIHGVTVDVEAAISWWDEANITFEVLAEMGPQGVVHEVPPTNLADHTRLLG